MPSTTKSISEIWKNSEKSLVLESENFSEEHGGCFAVIDPKRNDLAYLFLFSDGEINLKEHIQSLSKKLIQNNIHFVMSTVEKRNTKSLSILRKMTNKIDFKNGKYIGYGNLEDIKRNAEGNFLDSHNK